MWKDILINNRIFCKSYISGENAINIIITHTPIFSTTYIFDAYKEFSKYNVNVFAIDFSCTGNSSGWPKDFSLDSIVGDFKEVIDFIEQGYSDNIHVYGNTGIGGIFAQYALCSGVKVKSFAQFACANYGNTEMFHMPKIVSRLVLAILKLMPNVSIPFKEPKYTGYRAKEDDEVYKKLEEILPNFRKSKAAITAVLIESVVSSQSALQNDIECPTLVFKTLHDRYFPHKHFDDYYAKLRSTKKLVEINDVHNSYIITPETFCKEVYSWFASHC